MIILFITFKNLILFLWSIFPEITEKNILISFQELSNSTKSAIGQSGFWNLVSPGTTMERRGKRHINGS